MKKHSDRQEPPRPCRRRPHPSGGARPWEWTPAPVRNVLKALEAAGHEAWCVGGCVRDTLRGVPPHDWDVATSATPEEVMALFQHRTIPTGIKHGTVTVRSGGGGVEVTTFRCDGDYLDHRRPADVTFTRSLEEDLRRRDFTINAMAMSLAGELRDPLGGREDLRARILRCVGEPNERFSEDALRMMRTLRFAATLGFAIQPDTAAAVHQNRDLLAEIAVERIQLEILRLLPGKYAASILREYPDVIGVFWPEILPCIGFDQRNPHHCYDVWEHTLHALDAAPEDPVLRCALLLHDIGKPRVFSVDEQGIGHFYVHPAVSRDMADQMLRRLHCPNVFREKVLWLVERHDREIPQTENAVLRALYLMGADDLRLLLAMKRADNLAQAPAFHSYQQKLDQVEELIRKLSEEGACFNRKQLAVNGNDLKRLGLSGPAIGNTLQSLLQRVIDGRLPNERGPLMKAAKKRAAAFRRAQKEKQKEQEERVQEVKEQEQEERNREEQEKQEQE